MLKIKSHDHCSSVDWWLCSAMQHYHHPEIRVVSPNPLNPQFKAESSRKIVVHQHHLPVPASPLNCFLSCKIINNLWHEQSWEVENVLLCTIITLLPQREEAAALIKPEVYVNRRVKVAQICYITSWNFPIYFVRKLFLLKCWSWRRSTFQQQE